MQLNTLNRVIALFLVGGFVVILAAVALDTEIREFLEDSNEFGPSGGVFLAVALLSVTALAGTIVDAIGNLTARRLIKMLGRRRSLAGLLFCTREFDEHEFWRRTLRDVLKSDPKHKALTQGEDMIKALSAAIFFRTAEKEHAEWLIQHHSMFHLSTNFIVILIACDLWLSLKSHFYAASGCILAAYLLATFALDNYLYVYQLTFRNAYLNLKNQSDVAPVPKTPDVQVAGG